MRKELIDSVIRAADIVGSTFGPEGRNVFIASTGTFTKDGMTVAQALADTWQGIDKAGARLLLDACSRTAKVVGDGTTTTAILVKGFLESDVSPVYLSDVVPFILKDLVPEQCDYSTLVDAVTISANNNQKIGKMIADLVFAVGPKASVQGIPALGKETYTEIRQGYLTGGFAHPVFWDSIHINRFKSHAHIPPCNVVLVDQPLDKEQDIVSILKAYTKEKPMVIVAPSYGDIVLRTIIKNHTNLAVFPVILNEDRIHTYKDMSVGTGAKIFSNYGMKITHFAMSHTGECDGIEVRSDGARFMFTKTEEIKKHLELEEKNPDRTGQLSQGIGVVYVGGQTQSEQSNLSLLIEDAVMCAQSCLADGVLPGGGAALKKIAGKYPEIQDALSEPFNRIPYSGAVDAAMAVIKSVEHAASLCIELLKTEYVCE